MYVSSHHVMPRVGADHLACAFGVGSVTTNIFGFLFPEIRELTALALVCNANVICMICKSDILGNWLKM